VGVEKKMGGGCCFFCFVGFFVWFGFCGVFWLKGGGSSDEFDSLPRLWIANGNGRYLGHALFLTSADGGAEICPECATA